jgi:hypothetical protein
MVVLKSHPCPICTQDTYGEVHQECAEANFLNLPDPIAMTGDERSAEVAVYQNYPAGWPLGLLEKRVTALIGRPLHRPEPGVGDDSGFMATMLAEVLPRWTDSKGWKRLAEEAAHAYPQRTS